MPLPFEDYEHERTRPVGRVNMHMTWENLLFLHFPVEVDELRRHVPDCFDIDTFDGKAWIGLVLFEMVDVHLPRTPILPGMRRFPEFNVRTYVHMGGKHPGIYFFSLDAASPLAVRVARRFFHLPYFLAEMSVVVEGSGFGYRSYRSGVSSVVGGVFEGEQFEAEPSTFEHFVLERYSFLTVDRAGRPRVGTVRHRPYRVCGARLDCCEQNLTGSLGFVSPAVEHACFCSGVAVTGHRLETV